jgi:hypothetical protein
VNSGQWTVVSKNLATDAEFGINGCDQLNGKQASSFGWGPFCAAHHLQGDFLTGSRISPQPPIYERDSKAKIRSSRQEAIAATFEGTMDAGAEAGCGRMERNHPAASQERGIENSDQPQSRQTKTSGDGVMGGWLRVR